MSSATQFINSAYDIVNYSMNNDEQQQSIGTNNPIDQNYPQNTATSTPLGFHADEGVDVAVDTSPQVTQMTESNTQPAVQQQPQSLVIPGDPQSGQAEQYEQAPQSQSQQTIPATQLTQEATASNFEQYSQQAVNQESPENSDLPPPQDYLVQAQSAFDAVGATDTKKTLMVGGIALVGVIVFGIATLLLLGPKDKKTSTETPITQTSQQNSSLNSQPVEDLTVKIPANWSSIEDSEIGVRVKLPELDQFGTSGSSSSEEDGVTLTTAAYGIATNENEPTMSISLVRAKGLQDEKQLQKMVEKAGSPSSAATLIYKNIKSTLSAKNVNKQKMYVHEFSGTFASKKLNDQLFKSTTVYVFKDGICFGVIATTNPKNPDHEKELNYAYTVAATLEKL